MRLTAKGLTLPAEPRRQSGRDGDAKKRTSLCRLGVRHPWRPTLRCVRTVCAALNAVPTKRTIDFDIE